MRRILIGVVIATIISLLFGCETMHAIYDIGLYEVERPADAMERYGEQKIARVEEEEATKYSFEDDLVQIVWLAQPNEISFLLNNKTDYSIKIIWDEAAFVDKGGMSHRVMHLGVKYSDRNASQPPTVVARKGSIHDVVVPTDYVYYVSGSGWVCQDNCGNFSCS